MRKLCPDCDYPLQTCICHAVTPVSNTTEVIILQHPKESAHAKNTVKLLALCLSNISVYVGKSAADFTLLRHKLSTTSVPTAVFYPAPNSKILSATDWSNGLSHDSVRPQRILFIDASWKQAFGIWQNNPWLNQFPFYKLDDALTGQYVIRKSQLPYSLSTLEAVAHALHTVDNLNITPLLSLLSAFTQTWQHYLPE